MRSPVENVLGTLSCLYVKVWESSVIGLSRFFITRFNSTAPSLVAWRTGVRIWMSSLRWPMLR